MAEHHQNVIIGAGPGGYVAAIRLAQLGQPVTVIDKADSLGGTCLNWGCIPSKALIHAANLYEAMTTEAKTVGITADNVSIDLAQTMAWKDSVVNKLTGGIKQLFKHHKITTITAHAAFKNSSTLTLTDDGSNTSEITFDQCLIATGSKPVEIPPMPFDGEVIINSDTAVNLQAIPRHLVLIGGGVIGLELGVFYAKLGAQVSVVEAEASLMAGMDKDIVQHLTRQLKKRKNITLYLNTKAEKATVSNGKATVVLNTPKGQETLTADKVLVAVGRKANTTGLNLTACGLSANQRGLIEVDKHLRTGKQHIFAIGDCTPGPMLAHKASKDGLIAAAVMAGQADELDVRAMPAAVFTDPEIASVGLTEQAATKQGLNIKVGKFPLAANGRALTMNHADGMAKIITHADTDEILGVHMIGPHVAELIGEATLAIELGATAEDIALTVHTHPTLPEALMEAADAVHGLAIHSAK